MLVKNRINAMANLKFCSIDTTNTEVSAIVSGFRRTIRFSSVYLPYEDPDPLSAMRRDIVQDSAEEKKEIILGIDANAHHPPVGEHGHRSKGCVINGIYGIVLNLIF